MEFVATKFGIAGQNIQGSDESNPIENPAKIVFDYSRKIESQLSYITESLEEENLIRRSPMSVYFGALRKFQIKIKNIEKQNRK
jgi:folate-dependent tRNA-U54 methylase TrmFO/GidA